MTLKALCKKILYTTAKANHLKRLDAIEKASYVSFDVFDTLVKRDVAEPQDVFAYIEQLVKEDKTLPFEGFVNLRLSSERRARENALGREITLAEIYENMPVDKTQRDRLMQLECKAEIDLSAVNLQIKPLYDRCIEKGKAVCFISDMYLPAVTIEKILQKNGYTQGELFVSAESGLTKRDGKLFRYVQEAKGISFNNWVHIGDSVSSDYLAPRRLGIKAFLIKRDPRVNPYFDKKLYRKDSDYRQLAHFIDTRIGRYTDPYERIGYAVLGPLLYGFSIWLEKEVPPDETIVFLAREGALLQRAFQAVSDRPSVYLCASRHALNIVRIDKARSVEEVQQEKIDPVKRFSKQITWAKMYGLSDADVDEVFQREGLEENATVLDSNMSQRVLTAIWPTAKKNALGQYGLFRSYLERLGMSEKCAVVDIGWKGTMQTLLSNMGIEVNGRPIQWNGYYMALHEKSRKPPFNRIWKKAFLFDGGTKNSRIMDTVMNTISFFETLFISADGTTKGYAAKPGGAGPIFGPAENTSGVNQLILQLQAAGIAFVQDVCMSNLPMLEATNPILAVANYEALARTPTQATLRLFRDFYVYDERPIRLVEGEPFWKYIFHPKRFIFDLAQSGSKVWFLKNVFKLPLPYISVLSLARRIADKK